MVGDGSSESRARLQLGVTVGVGEEARVQGEMLRSSSGNVVKGELGGWSSVKGSEATELVEKDNGGDLRSRSGG